jgi:hypothetical protein
MKQQIRIFEVIKSILPSHVRLVDVIEELLGVSTDSAYRRIRGETELSFSEIEKICKKFDLSLDEVINNKKHDDSLFNYSPADFSKQEYYICAMEQSIKKMNHLVELSSHNEILYTAQDIPSYHFYVYPELSFFRVFVWNNILNRSTSNFSTFCNALDKDRFLDIYRQLHHFYMNIPSKEIWSEQTIDPYLRQLTYYYNTGAFEKDEILLLLDQFQKLINNVWQYAENGYKDSQMKIPFSQYLCSVDLDNNFMLLRNEVKSLCIIRLYSINWIVAVDPLLCSETQKWIESLLSKSILISGMGAYMEKFRLFNTMKSKIQNLIAKVNK